LLLLLLVWVAAQVVVKESSTWSVRVYTGRGMPSRCMTRDITWAQGYGQEEGKGNSL
jgi:hypothetical protein